MATAVSVPQTGTVFEIAPGSSFAAVAAELVAQGIIEDDFWYRLHARSSGEAGGIQAGEYRLEAGRDAASMLEQFTRGSVRLYSFTIIEGWNHRDLLQALHANEAIVQSMTDEDWPALLESLGALSRTRKGCSCPKPTDSPQHDGQATTQPGL